MLRLSLIAITAIILSTKSHAMSQSLYLISFDSSGKISGNQIRLSSNLLTFIFAYHNYEGMSCISALSNLTQYPIDLFFAHNISPNDGNPELLKASDLQQIFDVIVKFYAEDRVHELESKLHDLSAFAGDTALKCSYEMDLNYVKTKQLLEEILKMESLISSSKIEAPISYAIVLI